MAVSGTAARANARAASVSSDAAGHAAANRARAHWHLGAVKDHVALAAAEIGRRFNITTIGGWGTRPNPTDHDDGLALDFMCHGAKGTRLADYVIANGKRLGVTYLIYQQRINSLDGKGWEQMEDRGSATANHMDHVHVSFAATPGDANVVPSPAHARHRGMVTGAAGSTTPAELQDTLTKVAVTGLFVLAGAGLVVLGLGRVVQPAVKAAGDAATSAATKAASMAGPEGKAAATAVNATKGTR